MAEEAPLFNLKAVALQTGLKPDTLRAWERRYGLPCPTRSAGGQRLYTQRDIDVLRWLEARQHEGMTIARAVALFRQVEAEGHNPLEVVGARVSPAGPAIDSPASGTTLEAMREQWLAACLRYDRRKADQAAAQAFALYRPDVVCLDMLQWAVREVGELWRQGEVSVQQEHFVSELAVGRLEALLVACPPANRANRVLAACPPGEHHTFGLLLLTYLLRHLGWPVVYLGADVPVEQLDTAVSIVRPGLIIMAAQRLPSAATLVEGAETIQGLAPFAFAGGVFNRHPKLRDRVPGFFLGERIDYALRTADALLSGSRVAPTPEPTPEEARVARVRFQERRLSIEAEVIGSSASLGLGRSQATSFCTEVSQHLEAALALGAVSLLECGDLTEELGMPEIASARFSGLVLAYLHAAEKHLDQQGGLALDWLRGCIGR
ncbi:MAG TPA: MerR family transcriptional regulator [Anaerolineae bacterium]|nr:MerR family transcriptional regulator [Anaerolineae bacterium]